MPKILIIDDDVELCAALGKFLRRQGHDVITATDGQMGLAAALQGPDLIICDLARPVLNGHGVLEALRQDQRLADTPFIFLSGLANREMIRRSMNLGGDDFITKPADLNEILETVNSRLHRQQQRRQRQEETVKQAVELFTGIVNDLGGPQAAIEWLAEAAAKGQSLDKSATGFPPNPPSILISKDNRRFFLKLSEVKLFLADGEYSRAHWGRDQTMMFRKPLKQWETELPAGQFIRVHRQAIINLAFLDFVGKGAGGLPEIHLVDFPAVIDVSQRKVSFLNRVLKSRGKAFNA